MKILDFATSDAKTAMKIIAVFVKSADYNIRRILEALPGWTHDAAHGILRPIAELDGETVQFFPRRNISLRVWLQAKYYLMSFDLGGTKDPTWEALHGMVQVMRTLDRRDLPVKIDKGDTVTIKAAVAIAALVVAQGREDCSNILWDMARDKEI